MKKIIVHEVGMRDGLQMESVTVPTDTKIAWIETLFASHVDIIQLGSFVNPAKVPQMADTDALFLHGSKTAKKPAQTLLSGLVLNEKGLERADACGVDLLCMGVSASETHSQKNTGMSVDEATQRIIAMAQQALSAGKRVQVSVQSAFGCGFEGAISEEKVLKMVARYLEAGVRTISLADTAGHAYPEQVERLCQGVLTLDATVDLTLHIHNTYGLGIANCYAGIRSGASTIETAVGGLGGCPFTKQAAGNVCTEDLVHALQRNGIRNDIHLESLIEVSKAMGGFFSRTLPGHVAHAGIIHY